MLIAQISDPHVVAEGWLAFGRLDTGAMLERAVDTVLALDPPADAVLLTGDLVADPDEAAYARVMQSLARIDVPLFPLPGNHDDRGMMRWAFAVAGILPADGHLRYVVDPGPLRLICLDSLVEEGSWGLLGAEQIAWLDAQLSEAPERPTSVALHHPPIRTGIGHMDWSMLRDADALEAVIRRHPQVERVLCGHVHRNVVRRWAGTVVQICPGIAHAVKLVLGDGRGPWNTEPPAILLHHWSETGGLVTHHLPIGLFSEAGRFSDPHTPVSDER
jgi:Icc protein